MIILKNNGWHEWQEVGEASKDDKGVFFNVECRTCRMEGKRYQGEEYEVVLESPYIKRKRIYCVYVPSKIPRIKLINPKYINDGFEIPQVVEVVPCPRRTLKKYKKDPWVFSTVKNKAIRIERIDYEVA